MPTPVFDTATNVLFPNVTDVQKLLAAAVLSTHVIPSRDVITLPLPVAATATNVPLPYAMLFQAGRNAPSGVVLPTHTVAGALPVVVVVVVVGVVVVVVGVVVVVVVVVGVVVVVVVVVGVVVVVVVTNGETGSGIRARLGTLADCNMVD